MASLAKAFRCWDPMAIFRQRDKSFQSKSIAPSGQLSRRYTSMSNVDEFFNHKGMIVEGLGEVPSFLSLPKSKTVHIMGVPNAIRRQVRHTRVRSKGAFAGFITDVVAAGKKGSSGSTQCSNIHPNTSGGIRRIGAKTMALLLIIDFCLCSTRAISAIVDSTLARRTMSWARRCWSCMSVLWMAASSPSRESSYSSFAVKMCSLERSSTVKFCKQHGESFYIKTVGNTGVP